MDQENVNQKRSEFDEDTTLMKDALDILKLARGHIGHLECQNNELKLMVKDYLTLVEQKFDSDENCFTRDQLFNYLHATMICTGHDDARESYIRRINEKMNALSF